MAKNGHFGENLAQKSKSLFWPKNPKKMGPKAQKSVFWPFSAIFGPKIGHFVAKTGQKMGKNRAIYSVGWGWWVTVGVVWWEFWGWFGVVWGGSGA